MNPQILETWPTLHTPEHFETALTALKLSDQQQYQMIRWCLQHVRKIIDPDHRNHLLDDIIALVGQPNSPPHGPSLRMLIDEFTDAHIEAEDDTQYHGSLAFTWAIFDSDYASLDYFTMHVVYYTYMTDRDSLILQQQYLRSL